MKKLKIIFCILLVIAVALGAAGVRFGKNTLNATVETVMNTSRFAELYVDNSKFDDFTGFGYTWTEFQRKFIDNYENCYAQRMKVTLINENDFDITVLGVELKEGNGENQIYISETPERVITVPANTTEPMAVWFMVMTEGPEKDETLVIIREEVTMKIIYTEASNNIKSLGEAPKDALKYEWIR